jgi:hypothetical protein
MVEPLRVNERRMRAALAVVVVSMVVAGCGGRQRAATERGPSFPRGQYALRIISATIEPVREDGTPWHVTEPDHVPALVGAVVGLAAGQPEVGMALGNAIADKGGKPLPPVMQRDAHGLVVMTPASAPSFADCASESVRTSSRKNVGVSWTVCALVRSSRYAAEDHTWSPSTVDMAYVLYPPS